MIHYHGCPLSGGTFTQRAYAARHAMISFANQAHAELIIEHCQSFTIDNGAFTYWKQGNSFNLDGFGEFMERWYRHPSHDWYCIPDVIGGDHHDNAKIRAAWFNTVSNDIWKKGRPVWHLHEPLDVLKEMVVAWSGVCLGSSGEYSEIGTQKWWSRMAQAMDVICDEQGRPKVQIHGLRMLDNTVFSHLPLSSADSTNVARNCGIDKAWNGPYAPKSNDTRALVMMERIEAHASAKVWVGINGCTQNHDLFG